MGRGSIAATTMATVFALVVTSANAADQGITAKKLLLKGTPKLVLLSKDPTISIAGSDPIGGADSTISFDDGTTETTWSLPKPNWSANGSGTLFKFQNPAAPGGPSLVKIVKVKAGFLKVTAKGLPFAVPNGAATIDVILSLDGGTNRYCMTFSGTGDGNKFLVKNAAAGSCPPTQTCGNNVREGTEQCDGADATACPGQCQPSCTCPQCGNNVQEGSETCDGTDDSFCPNDCLSNCNCAAPCPSAGSDPHMCMVAFASANPARAACCGGDFDCSNLCATADFYSCGDESLNDLCTAAANAAGCAEECCAPAVMPKFVFLSHDYGLGHFGGIETADGLCQIEGGLGVYKAWLSDGNESAESRMFHWSGQYQLVDGTKVADNWTDLTDGTLDAPINLTAAGTPSPYDWVWTGTLSSGQSDSDNCSDWMSSSGTGGIGDNQFTDARWTDYSSLPCAANLARFYCIKQ